MKIAKELVCAAAALKPHPTTTRRMSELHKPQATGVFEGGMGELLIDSVQIHLRQ
jgi:hypothetical protein